MHQNQNTVEKHSNPFVYWIALVVVIVLLGATLFKIISLRSVTTTQDTFTELYIHSVTSTTTTAGRFIDITFGISNIESVHTLYTYEIQLITASGSEPLFEGTTLISPGEQHLITKSLQVNGDSLDAMVVVRLPHLHQEVHKKI